jgi:hypothetical protein
MHRRRVSSSSWCEQPGARAAMVDPTAAKLPHAIPETTTDVRRPGPLPQRPVGDREALHFQVAGISRHRRAGTPDGGWHRRHTACQPRFSEHYEAHKGSEMPQAQNKRRNQSAPVCSERRPRDLSSSLGPIGGAGRLVQMIGRAAMVQATELALMTALAAGAPGRLIGGGSDSESGVLRSANAHTAQAGVRPFFWCTVSGGRSRVGPLSRER